MARLPAKAIEANEEREQAIEGPGGQGLFHEQATAPSPRCC